MRSHDCNVFPLLLLLAAHAGFAQEGADWPRFRGPNGSGLGAATNLPTTWTEKDYRWKTALPGAGHASPALWADNLFLVCADKETARRTVVCLNARDGAISWKRDFESATFPKHRDNGYATSTPAVDSQRVYVYWTTLEEVTLLALDHSGKQVWRRNLGPFKSQHGSGTSPIVFQDLVIIGNDQDGPSSLLALDSKSGQTRWTVSRRTDRAAYATPVVRQGERGNPELVFASSAEGITGVDALSGHVNWEFTNAFPFRVVGSPVLADGLIVCTCGEGGVGRRLVAVRPPSGSRAPELAYEMKNSIPYVPTPLCRDGLLFLWGDNGLVVCHRATTGQRVWQHKISDSFYSSPVGAGKALYCVSKNGTVYVIAAADKPELLGTVPLGEACVATPAIDGHAIYFRTESHVWCLPAGEHAVQ